jgi:hypothetical protein
VEYKKNKWGYALLGIGPYYAGTFLGGILLFALDMLLDLQIVDGTSDTALGLLAFPFGLLAVWGLYKISKKNWSKNLSYTDSDSLDGDLISPPKQ